MFKSLQKQTHEVVTEKDEQNKPAHIKAKIYIKTLKYDTPAHGTWSRLTV